MKDCDLEIPVSNLKDAARTRERNGERGGGRERK
jgi:hypothetical protein